MKKYEQVSSRTRKNFFEAFWQLYRTSDNITISKICELANYDRTTFYRYFINISDILNQFEDEILNNLRNDIINKNNLVYISPDRFKIFTEKYGKYIIAFHDKGEKRFYDKFKEIITQEVYDLFDFNITGEVNKNFLYEFLFSSVIISYSYWYNHPDIMSYESFVLFLNIILIDGSKNIIKFLN